MAKKIIKADIESFERTEGDNPCHVCTNHAHPFFSDAVKKAKGKITYNKIEIDSDKARAHPDYNKVEMLPHTKLCKTYDNGKTSCNVIKGWNEKEFEELKGLF